MLHSLLHQYSIKFLQFIPSMNIETKSITNFLQVSVNTDKLSQFFIAVSNSIGNHERQIQQLSKQLAQVRISVEEKLSRVKDEVDYERQRNDKKRKDDDTFFNSLVQDTTLKQERLAKQTQGKFAELQEQIRIMKTQPIEQFKLRQLKNQLKEYLENHQLNIHSSIESINSKIQFFETELKNNSSTQDFLLKNMIQAYQSKGKADTEKQQNTSQKSTIIFRPNRQLINKDTLLKDQFFSSEQAAKQNKEKRKKKIDQRREMQNLLYASVSAKIDVIDQRLTAKQNESINKVMWAGKVAQISSQSSQKDSEYSMDRIEIQSKNLEYRITAKLEHIEQIIFQKIGADEKELLRLKAVCELLTDQMQISNRKLSKESSRLTDLFVQVKKIQEKRIDQKSMDNFIIMFKKQIRLLEQQVNQRLKKEDYQKQYSKITSKLDSLAQHLGDKAEKEQVKRAFRFVEDKIKEIVLIMAEQQQSEKDGGAGKKIPYKCLSCDKQLQSSLGLSQRPHLEPRLASRGSTSNLRKRIRVANGQQK